MHLFDFLRRIFPAAIPPAEPAIKPLRKPRAKKPKAKKTSVSSVRSVVKPKKK
jgi:hypothetical protein